MPAGGMRVVVDLEGFFCVVETSPEAAFETVWFCKAVFVKGIVTATAPGPGLAVVDVGSLIGARDETAGGGALRPDAGGSGSGESSRRVAMGTAARTLVVVVAMVVVRREESRRSSRRRELQETALG